ncbi:uncharacterized protein LOC132937383 [Metopolophium dirhodum]|uniref:uncharacterized protein LOC132937383 n=1 Tax=Metopolophium dirhodum TaxID=44670 RepID=UPI00298F97B2|nr:uncharacterized protein LOC132937383 [Metopolophium dirhodum]
MLHFEGQLGSSADKTGGSDNDSVVAEASQRPPKVLSAKCRRGHVFLATASVFVIDNHGELRKCRVVLDSGLQINFISSKFANQLQLSRQKTILPVSGIGASQVQSVSSITLKLKSRVKLFEAELICHVLPTIIDYLPCCPRPPTGWNIPEELLQVGTAYLQDTRLGWVVTGEVNATCLLSARTFGEICDDEFRALCSTDSTGYGSESKTNIRVLEENKALHYFKETVKWDETGRFILRLPFKPEVHELGGTLEMARSKFLSVERRLLRDDGLKLQYEAIADRVG